MNLDFVKKRIFPFEIAFSAFIVGVLCCSCGPTFPPVVETINHSNYDRERRYVVEGTPVFTSAGQSVMVEIQSKPVYQLWPLRWPEDLLPHRQVEGLSALRFELIEENYKLDQSTWPSATPVVRRVWNGDQLLLDTTPRCEVHHLLMNRQIEYAQEGDQSKRFFQRQKRLFPNDGKAYLLCGSGLRHFVWACPECERIQKREYSKQPWLNL